MMAGIHIHIGVNPFAVENGFTYKKYDEAALKSLKHPHIWVGNASYLKNKMYKDPSFVPPLVRLVVDLFPPNKLKSINRNSISQIENFEVYNSTDYVQAKADCIVKFLNMFGGQFAYTTSWYDYVKFKR